MLSDDHEPVPALIYAECCFAPLQGFLNACVYGYNERMKDRYLARCCGRSFASERCAAAHVGRRAERSREAARAGLGCYHRPPPTRVGARDVVAVRC
jgi:hypothetical protein